MASGIHKGRFDRPILTGAAAAAAVLATSLAASTFAGDWDGSSWVYTPETHSVVAPGTGDCEVAGLDAMARGFDATDGGGTVDKWYWTFGISNECPVSFDPPGMMIIIK